MQSIPLTPTPSFRHNNVSRWRVLASEWPTLLLLSLTLALYAGALALPGHLSWLAFILLVPVLTLHSSLSHEILHGHPFRSVLGQLALGWFQPGLFVPFLRFRAQHLAHHDDESLTDPYDDPETNYCDPRTWARLSSVTRGVLSFNNTLLGRMAIGPLLGLGGFFLGDLRQVMRGNRQVAWHWLAHLPGVLLTLWLVQLSAMPFWLYLAACYAATSVLKVRTFLEHRAHDAAAGRTVVIEDRGLFALLFLNNNFHSVHHAHPGIPWYRLPKVYRERRAQFLARNDGYVYRSYAQIFRQYFLRRKDPVPHPLWQRREN